MSLRKSFSTDKAKETEGVPVSFESNENGTIPTFYLSRMAKSNKRYAKTLEAACRPHQRAIKLETLSEEVADKLFLGVFLDSVLLRWENVYKDDDCKELIETKEEMLQFLLELPELYEELKANSNSLSLFREDEVEENAKN